jgi:predicted nucleic acid-binding protein
MPVKIFVDTNVLIYAIETSGPDVKKAAAARQLIQSRSVCISTQVLGEFYRAVTSARRSSPLKHDEAVAWVQLWKKHEVCGISVGHVDLALDFCHRYRIAYFDALILSSAHLAECETVYSEDLSHDQVYGRTQVQNPFREN